MWDGPAVLKQVMGRVQAIAHRLLEALEHDENTEGTNEPPSADVGYAGAQGARAA